MERWERRDELIRKLEDLAKLDELNDEQQADWNTCKAEIEKIDEAAKRETELAELSIHTPQAEENRAKAIARRAEKDAAEKAESVPAEVTRWSPTRLRAYETPDSAYRAGQWISATLFGNPHAARWCQEHGLESRAMTGSTATLGGYTVPLEMENRIIRLVEEYGVFRRFARNEPMASDTKDVPVRDGGLTVYYPGEGGAITTSDVTFSNAKLVSKKMATLTAIASELSEDSVISIADLVTTEIAQAFANAEDDAGFNGDGTSTYGHMVGLSGALLAGSNQDAASGNTGFETLDLADFEGVISKLPRYPGIMPRWFIHSTGYWLSMGRLLDAGGGNTVATLQAGAQESQFLGFPVTFSQVLNSTAGADASTIKCYFGDLGMGAMFGIRRGVTVDTSTDVYFANDQIGIRGTQRVDVNIHSTGTASVAGAIIKLTTAAS